MSNPVETPPPGAVAGDRVRRVDARRNLEAIIEAAVPLLCEHPRASMQQIAAAAGLHRATVHRHFPSRDDLLQELRERTFLACSEAVDEVIAHPSADPGETVLRATIALVGVGDRFRLYRYTAWRSTETDDQAQQIGASLSALVTEAQAAGSVRSDLPVQQLVTAIGGLIWAVLPEVASGGLSVDEASGMIRTLISAPR